MAARYYHLDEGFVDAVRQRAKSDWRSARTANALRASPVLDFPEITSGTGKCPVIVKRTSSKLRKLAKAIGYDGPIRGEAVDR